MIKTNEIMISESKKNAAQSGIQSDIRTGIMPRISVADTDCDINQAAAHPRFDALCRKEIFREMIVKQGVLAGSYIEGEDIFAKNCE